MKKLIEEVKELGQSFLLLLAIAVLTLGPLFGSIKYEEWKNKRESYHEIAHHESKKYITDDRGYHTILQSTTLLYGNGDTVTQRSLRFIPSKINTFFSDSTSLEDITLWDDDNNNTWDRIFICGYPTNKYGANSVTFRNSKWEWNPCPSDEGKLEPFSSSIIDHVLSMSKNIE